MTSVLEEKRTVSSLCVDLLHELLGRLREPEHLEIGEQVHDLRVATKQLRAAWHLVKELAAPGLPKRRRIALRELSARLSSRRDEAVLDELVRALAARETDPRGGTALLFDRLAPSRQPARSRSQPCPNRLFEDVRETLEAEIIAWESIDWEDDDDHPRKAIRRSLRIAERKVRRWTEKALGDRSPEIWHRWRKAVKRLRYQREFVAGVSGRTLGKRDARISRLGTVLGQRNDLASLRDWIQRRGEEGEFDAKELKQLHSAVSKAEREIFGNCRRLGRRLIRGH